jgi:tetratricopeptide (TPR) repeat protein
MLKKFDHQVTELTSNGDRAAAEDLRERRNDFFFDNIQQRVAKYPNDLNLRYELGVALCGRSMFNEAIQQFQLSQRNPRWHIKSLYHLGLCFKAKKQYDLALDQFGKAALELISMDSTKKDVYYEMGLIKEAMDDLTGAQQLFKEIYQADIAYKDVARRVEQGYGR